MLPVLLMLACSGDSPQPGSAKEVLTPLHTLEEATEAPWVRSVWWTGEPGDSVEGMIFRETPAGRHPVIAVDSAGPRRTIALVAPDQHEILGHHIKPDDAKSRTLTIPGAGKRILIKSQDDYTRVRAVEMHGKGTVDLIRDPTGPDLAHPTANADANAVYIDHVGGGILRVDLDGGTPERITTHAGRPMSWPSGDERVAVVDQTPGRPPQIHVLSPVPDNLVPASQALAEIPQTMYAVSQVGDRWYAFRGCDGLVQVDASIAEDHVEIIGVRATQASTDACGDGCDVLYDNDGDVLVEVARVASTDGSWTFRFSPQTGARAPGTWASEQALAQATSVTSCAEPIDENIWLQTYRHFGTPKETWKGLEANHQRVQVGGARAKGKQPFVVQLPHNDRTILARNTSKFMEFTNDKVDRPNDDVRITTADGGIVWTTPSTRESSPLMPPSEERDISTLSMNDDMSVLVYADAGAQPGIYRITLADSQISRIAPGGEVRSAAVYERAGHEEISWISTVDKLPVVVSARPWVPAMLEAWQSGPRTLLELGSTWVSIQRKDGSWTRCTGPHEVKLDLEAEDGPRLTRANASLPVHAAYREGSDIHLMGRDEDGIVRVVATMLAEKNGPGATWTWRLRTPGQPLTAASWVSEDDAEGLATMGACRKF